MPLDRGVKIGPYEIQSALGSGGMSEVYKARDTRLDRTVAIKVLPNTLAADPEFRERFDREARAISQLTHPHICALYDVGDHQGTAFLVLECLEGETLEHRIKNGALAVDEALRIAIQIADALAAAHDAEIVHGDVKPSNVMVTRSGVKLLDFGLATVTPPRSSERYFGVQGLPSDTVDINEEQKLLGSLPYMAPEQLDGRPIDARTDIFAFGVVFYEMLTGELLFTRQTVASTIAAILSGESAHVRERHPEIPGPIVRLLATCLASNPDDRWRSAADLKRALQWLAIDLESTPSANQQRIVSRGRRWTLRFAGLAASLVAVIALAAVLVGDSRFRNQTSPTTPIQLVIEPPPGTRFSPSASLVSVSPDGRQVAFLALGADGINHIWIRSLQSIEPRQLPGTDYALGPFWSPDSRLVGFFSNNALKIVDVDGGPVRTLCSATTNGPAGTWNRDGVILFSAGSNERAGIYRVSSSSSGGPATPIRVAADGDDANQSWQFLFPVFLPDGRHFIYRHGKSNQPANDLFVGSLDSSDDRLLLSMTANVTYTPPGYFVFRRGDTLLAQPFDPIRVVLSDQPAAITHDVGYNPYNGRTMFSVSADTLVYRPRATRQLVWFDRTGRREAVVPLSGSALDVALSPEEWRLAITRADPATGTTDIWVIDMRRGVSSRLTALPGNASGPIWSPDGQHVMFASTGEDGQSKIFEIDPSGARAPSPMMNPGSTRDWSRDGRTVLYSYAEKLFALPAPTVAKGEAIELPFTAPAGGGARGGAAALSPDGRWIAYGSNESGQDQVYIRSFPGGQHKSQISSGGGAEPKWRGDGRELYYLASDGHVVAVSISTQGDALEIGPPRPLFATRAAGLTLGILGRQQYAVTRDGQRFLVNEPIQDESTTQLIALVNWRAALTH